MRRLRTTARVLAAGMLAVVSVVSACDRAVIELLDEGAAGGGSGGGASPVSGRGGVDASSPRLDASTETPGTSCTAHFQCDQPMPVCEPTLGVCVECSDSRDCDNSFARRCDTSTHECVQCLDNADCPYDTVCDGLSSLCLIPCASDASCFGGYARCDADRGVCVQCLTNIDCEFWPGDAFCSDGRCGYCLADDDCGADNPHCDTRTRECVSCLEHEHCPAGFFCNPFERECRN